jgi:hypothetical protein
MTEKRFQFNGANNCIEYDNESILLDSYGEDIAELLNEQHETIHRLKQNITELLSVDIEEELLKENEQLKFGNKNLKAILNDFINILNRLQSNPTDKQTLGVARDMLQNMGKELEE